jgi:polyhydroxyalkanoate synthase
MAPSNRAAENPMQNAGVPGPEMPIYDAKEAAEMAAAMAEVGAKVSRLLAQRAEQWSEAAPGDTPKLDPFNLSGPMMEWAARLWNDPTRFVNAQLDLWQNYLDLWNATSKRLLGEDAAPVATPEPGDKRFKDAAWSEATLFDFLKQSYLLTSRFLRQMPGMVEGIGEKDQRKLDFYNRLFVDAMSPTNFVATNPEVLRETLARKGENLVIGFEHLLQDLQRGGDAPLIRMTDTEAFEVGRNLATTPGKIVFQNDLMQLIQYTPTTETVHARPLVVIPPWINKYYILDLKPENSFVAWAVAQGYTVFMISWVNPGTELAAKSFADYMHEGFFAALDAARRQTGADAANVVGYCLGGTLLGASLAWLKAKGRGDEVASATFFTALLDFSDVGDISVFIDEAQVEAMEDKMREQGYFDARSLHTAFNLLRSNDLIWSFVINNYLLGREPVPFDLLYWNGDSTNMPAAMHSFYLRHMYIENRLVRPGGIDLDGVAIDLGSVTTPSVFIATKEDHIAPWKTVYRGAQRFTGPLQFILGASGHTAGIVNPPAKKKYGYWTNAKIENDPDTWLASAAQHPGSWWNAWEQWLRGFAGETVPARDPSAGPLAAIEDAPGAYVKVRAL